LRRRAFTVDATSKRQARRVGQGKCANGRRAFGGRQHDSFLLGDERVWRVALGRIFFGSVFAVRGRVVKLMTGSGRSKSDMRPLCAGAGGVRISAEKHKATIQGKQRKVNSNKQFGDRTKATKEKHNTTKQQKKSASRFRARAGGGGGWCRDGGLGGVTRK